MKTATCPHCHTEMYSNNYGRHIARCTHSAEVMERTREIVTAEYGGQLMGQSNYTALAAEHKLPTRVEVVRHFGSWQAFCDWAGCESIYKRDPELDKPAERLPRSSKWDWPQTFAVEPRVKVYFHWTLRMWVAGEVMRIR